MVLFICSYSWRAQYYSIILLLSQIMDFKSVHSCRIVFCWSAFHLQNNSGNGSKCACLYYYIKKSPHNPPKLCTFKSQNPQVTIFWNDYLMVEYFRTDIFICEKISARSPASKLCGLINDA